MKADNSTMQAAFRKFVQGTLKRFCRETASTKAASILTRQLQERIRDSDPISQLRSALQQDLNKKVAASIPYLARSDHLPIRCDLRCSGTLTSTADSARQSTPVEAPDGRPDPEHVAATLNVRIASFNIQEFVFNGVTTYVNSLPFCRNQTLSKYAVRCPIHLT